MYLKKYLFALVGILFLLTSCDEDLKNPELADADLKVYFENVGDNVEGIAWEGYNVIIGESLTIKLQVSPFDGTQVKWVNDADGTILSETLEYTYSPTQEESKRVVFIATRPSYEKTIVFNFRGVLEGYTSNINSWQSFAIPQGTQTGTFTAEFDMIPSRDIMDGVVGFLDGVSTTYSDNSCIVRLNSSGKIDAYNDTGYAAENELVYHAGMTYHVKIDVDAVTMTYDVTVTEQGGSETIIASDYIFRRKITHLNYWSMVAGDWQLTDPGTHRVLNMEITTLTQNEAPVFIAVDDMEIQEGSSIELQIEAIDPLGGTIVLNAIDLPQFASFTDDGFGHGTLYMDPYENCGGCDLGLYDMHITATNTAETTDLHFNVEVIDPNAAFDIPIHTDDATVWGNGATDNVYIHLFGGRVAAGVGGEDEVVGVMPFALPDVPAGKVVKSAVLKVVTTTNNAWVAVDYDVYAIQERASSEVLSSDFFIGDYGTDTNATEIQQGFIKNGDGVGEVVMDVASGINLAAYMNSRYDNGATAGQFMFLRINANRAMPLWAHLQFKSADTDVAGTEPVLTVVFEDE